MNDVTAILQVFYPERYPYLLDILREIREAGIDRIIVWNNNPKHYLIPDDLGVEHIRSSFDTLIGQYAAAFLASTPIIYCQNDDLLVTAGTVLRMREHVDGDWFVTLSGVMLNRASERPYSQSTIRPSGPCDVMQGRSWMASKSALIRGISRSLRENINPGLGEDLFFSFGHAFVLSDAEFTNLDEGKTGLSRLPGHTEERDRWAQRLLS